MSGGAASRRKGHVFERWVANRLKGLFPDAKRGLQYQDGKTAPDVRGCEPFWIECKASQASPVTALKQAILDAETHSPGHLVVAICKRPREPPTATMTLDDWIELVGESCYRRKGNV